MYTVQALCYAMPLPRAVPPATEGLVAEVPSVRDSVVAAAIVGRVLCLIADSEGEEGDGLVWAE